MLIHDIVGVVLTGGESKRMGRPKALITHDGIPLFQFMAQLLQNHFSRVVLSHHPGRFILPDHGYEVITDRYTFSGPINGILSCLETLEKPICILPCDTPFVTSELIRDLMNLRNSSDLCTMYYHGKKGYYEPLIGIWETKSIPVLIEAIQKEEYSLQKLLRNQNVPKHTYPNADVFKNINSPVDLEGFN